MYKEYGRARVRQATQPPLYHKDNGKSTDYTYIQQIDGQILYLFLWGNLHVPAAVHEQTTRFKEECKNKGQTQVLI